MYSQRRRLQQPVESILDLQSIGLDLKIYGEISDPAMRHFNPSIAWHDHWLYIAIRSCNFAVERFGKWYLRDQSAYSKTDVIYALLDPDSLEIGETGKLELSKDTPLITKLAGLEDVRLFSRKDGMHAIGFESDRITRSLHNASATMAEYLIKGNKLKYLRTLEKPSDKIVEKNWSPTDVPTKAFDFTYSPTQVWKDGEVIGEKYLGDIHGGTQLLKQKDGTFLSLVHDKQLNRLLNRPGVYDKYVYRHYLARHDKNGIIIEKTKPFTFGTHENIEFASGMVEHNGDFIISLGIRDCKFALCKISKDKLVNMLEEI